MRADLKTVVLVVKIWQRTGGLEAVNRDVAIFFKYFGWCVKVLSVFGKDDDQDSSEFDVSSLCPRGKYRRYLWCRFFWKYFVGLHVKRILKKGDMLIIGHAHLLPLIDSLPQTRIFKKWVWIYGIEVWGSQAMRWVPFINKCDRVISISSFTADQVTSKGLTCPISIVPCCVDTTLFTPTTTPERIRRDEILICGRMAVSERYKGHQILFESISIVENLLGHPISLRVIGSGDDQPRLEAIVKQLGLSNRVSFAGRVSNEELVESYQHCGLFCMPSYVDRPRVDRWTGEGFGIVYVEAAACARPVIASNEGGAPETIIPGKTGLLIDPRSANSVARAIAEIVSDPARADEMGRQGRILALARFSQETFIGNVSNLLKVDAL